MSQPFPQSQYMQQYFMNNPNSILARFFNRNHAQTVDTTGSNNAATVPYVKPTQTPDTRPPVRPPGLGNGGAADVPRPFGSFGTITNTPYNSGYSISTGPMSAEVSGTPYTNDWGLDGSHAPPNQGQWGIPSFAAGGMMGPSGDAIRPGAPPANSSIPSDEPQMGADAPMPMDGGQLEQEAQKFVQANPQAVQQIQAVIQHAMQTGQLTYQELNMAVQLAKTALANPASYPQVRAFAIKNGLGTDADLPQTIDRGLLFTLMIVGKGLQSGGGNAQAQGSVSADQAQPKAGMLPEYSDGGMTGDKKHLAVLHPEEYVVPRDVVLYHGKKHLDKLVEAARTPKDASTGM